MELMERTEMKKTVSFAVVHFTVAFSLAYLLTGSILVGGLLAVLEPTLNTVAYHVHEKAWERLQSRPRTATTAA